MAISWTKTWSASDDGMVLSGADIGNIQTNIETYTAQLSGTQTITGDKTFSGTVTITGDIATLVGVSQFVFYDGDIVGYDGDIVYLK